MPTNMMTPHDANTLSARPSTLRVWVSALRPQTLAAGGIPVLIGAALAVYHERFHGLSVAFCMAGALALQITSNFANDAFDYLKGADNSDRIGPARATQRGWVTPRQMLLTTGVAACVSLLIGLWLMQRGGLPIALIGIGGLICAVAYTGGPYPLGYLGLGDVLVFLFFGLAAVGGTVWVQAPHGELAPTVWLAACAAGALATAILVVNNLRDRHTDAASGKRTLAVRFGERAARWQWTTLVVGAYVCSLVAAWMDREPAWLATLVTTPWAVRTGRAVWRTDGADLNPLLGATARLELGYGLTLSVALLVAHAIQGGG